MAFASPFLIGFAVFYAYPIAASAFYSFTDFNLFQSPNWVGTRNYERLFDDARFWKALKNTLVLAAIGLPLTIGIALGGAHLLNFKVRGQPLYRAMIYLPSIVPVVVGGYLWRWLLNGQYGFINHILSTLGIPAPNWLEEPNWAQAAVIIMTIWTVGGTMIIYLAALKDVPAELYEAASMDGAGPLSRFRHVTWPTISPVTLFQVIVIMIAYLQLFAQPYLLAQQRLNEASFGPEESLVTYATYVFQNAFVFLKMGQASAMAWILFIITLIITLGVLASSRWWVHNDSK